MSSIRQQLEGLVLAPFVGFLVVGLLGLVVLAALAFVGDPERPAVAVGESLEEVLGRLGRPDRFEHRMVYPVGVFKQLVIHLDDTMTYERAGKAGQFEADPLPFDAVAWREQEREHRQHRCADLLDGGHLEGLDRNDIVELLGPPLLEKHWQSYSSRSWVRQSVLFVNYGVGNRVESVNLMVNDD